MEHGTAAHLPIARENTISLEHFFTCPYCCEETGSIGEKNGNMQKILKCVCLQQAGCNPIEIKFKTDSESVTNFSAKVLN